MRLVQPILKDGSLIKKLTHAPKSLTVAVLKTDLQLRQNVTDANATKLTAYKFGDRVNLRRRWRKNFKTTG